jgi:oligopeptide transport system permease protein
MVVSFLTFCIMHAIPGDPFTQDQALPEETVRALHRYYGLDQPLYLQYLHYLGRLLHFDLGPSMKYEGRSVNQIIAEGFPVSFLLGLEAFLIAAAGGIFAGACAALHYLKWRDKAILLLAVLGISVPSFILGTLLQYFFAMKLDLFPLARWGTFSQTVLPALTLSAFPLAFIARLARATILEALQEDYILVARAKGITRFQLLYRHLLRNSLIPVMGYLGPLIGTIFTGSFVIEKIYGIPGLGQWMVASIQNRDYSAIMGLALFYSALLMGAVFLAECTARWMDPRIGSMEEADASC